jgi:hypothetical protein
MPNKTISKTIFIAFRNYRNRQSTKSKTNGFVTKKGLPVSPDIGMSNELKKTKTSGQSLKIRTV